MRTNDIQDLLAAIDLGKSCHDLAGILFNIASNTSGTGDADLLPVCVSAIAQNPENQELHNAVLQFLSEHQTDSSGLADFMLFCFRAASYCSKSLAIDLIIRSKEISPLILVECLNCVFGEFRERFHARSLEVALVLLDYDDYIGLLRHCLDTNWAASPPCVKVLRWLFDVDGAPILHRVSEIDDFPGATIWRSCLSFAKLRLRATFQRVYPGETLACVAIAIKAIGLLLIDDAEYFASGDAASLSICCSLPDLIARGLARTCQSAISRDNVVIVLHLLQKLQASLANLSESVLPLIAGQFLTRR